jgi:hypothetical protein
MKGVPDADCHAGNRGAGGAGVQGRQDRLHTAQRVVYGAGVSLVPSPHLEKRYHAPWTDACHWDRCRLWLRQVAQT